MLGAAQRMGNDPPKACLLLSLPMVVLFWVGLESQGGFALGLEALVTLLSRMSTSFCSIAPGGASRSRCWPGAVWGWRACSAAGAAQPVGVTHHVGGGIGR